jgi:hypothetical protein
MTARVANRPDLEIYRSVLDADRQRDPQQDVLEYAGTAGRRLDGSRVPSGEPRPDSANQ